MKSFETYVLQHKHKNLQPGDKIKLRNNLFFLFFTGNLKIKPNIILTFLEVKEFSGKLYIKVEEYSNIFIDPENIIKI